MKVRFFLLVLFCSPLFIMDISAQILVERLVNGYTNEFNFEGNVKFVVAKKIPNVSSNLKFDLSLIETYKDTVPNSNLSFNKDGKIIKSEYFNCLSNGCQSTWEYDKHILISYKTECADTIKNHKNVQYIHDDQDRLSKILLGSSSVVSTVEEFEYTDNGKRSIVYTLVNHPPRLKTEEHIYDYSGKLVKRIIHASLLPGAPQLTKYYYNDNNQIEFLVHRSSISDNEPISGTYHINYYNKNGSLKKTKTYSLDGEKNENGEDKYWKGEHFLTSTYKQKRKNDYIFQSVTTKRKGVAKYLHSKTIYDNSGNKVLEYIPDAKTLEIWDISYYE